MYGRAIPRPDGAQAKINKLHKNGKVVVCYISIGTVEDWRDDADDFPADAIGNDLADWEGEKWLDVNSQVLLRGIIVNVENMDQKLSDKNDPE